MTIEMSRISLFAIIVFLLQTRIGDAQCSGGTPYSYNSNCYATCPPEAVFTINHICYPVCPPEARNNYYALCMSTCPGGAPYISYNHECGIGCPSYRYGYQCYATCPTTSPAVPYSYNLECLASCPTAAPNSYNFKCYTTCPTASPAVPYLYNQQCYATCPAEAPYSYNYQCYPACPAAAPNSYNSKCYTTCPTTSPTAPYLYNQQCYTTCPAAAPNNYNNQCYATCPTTSPTAPYLYNQQCYTTCPVAVPNVYNYQCYSTCPAAAPYLYNQQCYTACPTAAPNSYNSQCYTTCPTTSPTAPYLYNQQCYTTCPAAAPNKYNSRCYSTCPTEAPNLYNNDCYATCPASVPYLYNNECYATCPAIAINVYNQQCYTICPTVAPYLYNQQCFITCPPEAKFSYNYQCYPACPTFAPNIYNNECFITCPAIAPVLKNNICSKSTKGEVLAAEKKFASTAIAVTSSMSASNSFFVLLAGLSNMFLYIRYMRINYPENVKVLFLEQDVELFSISLSLEVPASVEESLPQRPLPDVFEAYDVQSSFLDNLWSPIVTLAAVLVATIVVILLESLTRSYGTFNAVAKKLSSYAKWNLALLVICGNYCDVIFYLAMEFRTVHLDSTGAICSFVACVVMILISMSMLLLLFTIVRNILWSKQNKKPKRNWEDFSLLYEEFKEDSYLTLGYLLIFFGRDTGFNLLIAYGFDYPLMQTIILTIFSTTMVLYLIIVRPFKSWFQLLQISGNEIMLLILNVSILTLAIFDKMNMEAVDERNNIGKVVIILNLVFSSVNLLCIFTGIIQGCWETYKKYKAAKAKNIHSFVEIFKYILQSEQPNSPLKIQNRLPKATLEINYVDKNNISIGSNTSSISSSYLKRESNIPQQNTLNPNTLDLSYQDLNASEDFSLTLNRSPQFAEPTTVSRPQLILDRAKYQRRHILNNPNYMAQNQLFNAKENHNDDREMSRYR